MEKKQQPIRLRGKEIKLFMSILEFYNECIGYFKPDPETRDFLNKMYGYFAYILYNRGGFDPAIEIRDITRSFEEIEDQQ